MRWQVQIGINSTSVVWKFCQNWTSRRDEMYLIVRATSHDYLFIISMVKLDTSQCQHHILSPKPSPARLSTKIWCFCSYFHLVPLAQFHFTPFCLFCSTINEIIVLLSTNQYPVILSC
jgi:hypothetical protein